MKDSSSGTTYKYQASFPHSRIGHTEALSPSTLFPEQIGFGCLLFLVAVTATPFGMTSPLWEVILTCTIILLAAIRITASILLGRSVWGEYKMILAPLLCLLLLAFIQTIQLNIPNRELVGVGDNAWWAISADPAATRRFVFILLSIVLFGYLLLQYTSTPLRLTILVHFIVGLTVVSAVLGMVQHIVRIGPTWLFPYAGLERAYGQFGNRNHFALMMEMGLGLVFGLIATCGAHRKHLGPYIVAASIISLAIVLTTSRGGITSMLCMFLMAVASLVMGRRAKVPQDEDQRERSARGWGIALIARVGLGGAAFITFFIAVVWIGGDPLASRFERTNSDMVVQAGAVNPKEGRIRIWHGTLELIKAHPIMGVGFGGYATAIPRYHEDTGEFIPYEAHNDFLELQASGGVVGTILFVWFIVELFKRSFISLRSKQSFRKAVALGSLVGLCGVALHSLVDFGLHTPLNFIVCTILVVLITVRNPSSQEVPG